VNIDEFGFLPHFVLLSSNATHRRPGAAVSHSCILDK
jgi:hypothetical protein